MFCGEMGDGRGHKLASEPARRALAGLQTARQEPTRGARQRDGVLGGVDLATFLLAAP